MSKRPGGNSILPRLPGISRDRTRSRNGSLQRLIVGLLLRLLPDILKITGNTTKPDGLLVRLSIGQQISAAAFFAKNKHDNLPREVPPSFVRE